MGDNELSQSDIDALFSGGGSPEPMENSTNPEQSPSQATSSEPKTDAASSSRSGSSAVDEPEPKRVAQPVKFGQLQKREAAQGENSIEFLLDVPVNIAVELGRTNMFIKNVLTLGVGSVVELNKLAGEPVDLLINGKLVARGEVVVINENFGVKIIDIVSPEQRIKNLS